VQNLNRLSHKKQTSTVPGSDNWKVPL